MLVFLHLDFLGLRFLDTNIFDVDGGYDTYPSSTLAAAIGDNLTYPYFYETRSLPPSQTEYNTGRLNNPSGTVN